MKEQLTEEQKKFLTAEGKVVVKACPGSGKTEVLAIKVAYEKEQWKLKKQGFAGSTVIYECGK